MQTGAQKARPTLEPLRFGEFLVEKGMITEGQLLDALAEHWVTGEKIGQAIVRKGFLEHDVVERLAAEYHGLEVVEIAGAVS